MMSFRSTFWVSLITLASIVDAYLLSTNTFCIQVDRQKLCPGDSPILVGTKFRVLSGFAPYSESDENSKPKWDDEFQIRGEIGNNQVVFGSDYCLFTKITSGVRWLGCAEDCHRGGPEKNPWFNRRFSITTPDYGDPVAGQHNRYLPATPNRCPNPNVPLTSQLENGSGYMAANNVDTAAREDTTENTAGDNINVPGSFSEVPGVQTDSQNQYYPDTQNQASSGSNALGIKEANALLPGITPGIPNPTDSVPNFFPTTDATGFTNINPLGSTGNTVIGSGGTTSFMPSNTGATLLQLGTGIGTIGTTAGTTQEGSNSKTLGFDTFGAYAPLFRKRNVKSARDFRLFDFTATE
ncbi:hypothetical protein MMC07_003685 [Pseudocyphellaria aurata]|nr:hypothetical protein [Pseudocyphellaria aurata]